MSRPKQCRYVLRPLLLVSLPIFRSPNSPSCWMNQCSPGDDIKPHIRLNGLCGSAIASTGRPHPDRTIIDTSVLALVRKTSARDYVRASSVERCRARLLSPTNCSVRRSRSDDPTGRATRARSPAGCGARRHRCGRWASTLPLVVRAAPKAGSSRCARPQKAPSAPSEAPVQTDQRTSKDYSVVSGRRETSVDTGARIDYAQPRALGRKASDEFTVPLCRMHHREVHRLGNEQDWWQAANIDPLDVAQKLWNRTRVNEGGVEADEPGRAPASAAADPAAKPTKRPRKTPRRRPDDRDRTVPV